MSSVLHIIDRETPAEVLGQLSLLADDGDIIASAGPTPPSGTFDLPVRSVHCPLGLGRLAGWCMDDLAAQAEIIHAWSSKAAMAARTLARLFKLPPLLSLPYVPSEKAAGALLPMTRKAGFGLTVPTQAARNLLLRAGFDDSSVHVLPPPARPLDDAEAEDRRRRTRQALGVGDGQHLLVVPSEMIRQAGHKYASWAHAILRQMLSGVLLLMPGGGPVEKRVRFFAATTGYNDEVFFTEESLSRQDVLSAGDIALFLSSGQTGITALAAAMAAGVAIVASNTPEHAECAPHEIAALLCPPRDPRAAAAAILQLIENPKLAHRLAAGGRDRARQAFDPDRCRQRLAEIYAAAKAACPR